MNVNDARALAAALTAAADQAEAQGLAEIPADVLGSVLEAEDDAARAELEAAIRRAGGGG